MFGGASAKPPPVPDPLPIEREVGDTDEAKRTEQERIRRMRGRLSTFLTKGLMSEPTTASAKLGT
jgi:hypothetical protein